MIKMGKILSKTPCNSDLFEGQAHMKLAEVIANEIETDEKCTILGMDNQKSCISLIIREVVATG